MDNLVIIALSNEFHLTNTPLTVFEIILFQPSLNELKNVIQHANHEIPPPCLLSLEHSKQDGDALHVTVSCRVHKQQDLLLNEFFLLFPGQQEHLLYHVV